MLSEKFIEARKATQWPRGGVSPNPRGRPKKPPITDELRKLLPKPACGSKLSNAHLIAQSLIERAQTGDVQAARLVLEYVEGKPVQPIDIRRSLEDEATRLADELGMDLDAAFAEVEAVFAEGRRR